MKRNFAIGIAVLVSALLILWISLFTKHFRPEACPSYFQKNLTRVSGKIEADRTLRITYLFRLNYGSSEDLDFIATDIGENPRLRYIKYLGDGKFAEDTSFPLIPTEHARDLVAFMYQGKKAFAITDHGIDRMPFKGGEPRIVVLEKSGWTDQSKKILPPLRSFNFTLAPLARPHKNTPDLFLATVAQIENGNSVLLESNSEGKYKISSHLPQEFSSPDFCYMMVRKLTSFNGADYLYLGACDRPEDAVLHAHDRLLKIEGDKISLLPQDLLPPREKHPTWGTVSGEIADLNNDGLPDIVAVVHNHGFTQGGIQIYLNSGKDLKFRSGKKNYYEIGSPDKTSFIPFVKIGDLDGDKLPELLIPHVAIPHNGKAPESIQKFGLFKNSDGENFKDISQCLNTDLKAVMNVELIDLDQDGKLDILLMDYHGRYEIYFNQ